MFERVLIAGSGGQGVILAGRLLARSALDSVPHITFFPSYGAEVRGGTSNCQVVLSEEEIASPVNDEFEAMLILNPESLAKFQERRGPETLLVVNSSLCETPEGAVPVPATEIAQRKGNLRIANMIMLGAYLARHPVVPLEAVEKEIAAALSGKAPTLVALNLEAFREGLDVGSA